MTPPTKQEWEQNLILKQELAEAQSELENIRAHLLSECKNHKETHTELDSAKVELEAHRIYRRKWLASEKQVAELKVALERILKAASADCDCDLIDEEEAGAICSFCFFKGIAAKTLTPPDQKE